MTETQRWMLFGAFLFGAGVLAFVSNTIISGMIGKIDGGNPVSRGFFTRTKYRQVRKDYQRLYPEGPLLRRYNMLSAGSMVLLVCAALTLFRVVG